MATVLKATYTTGLTQAGLSDRRFSLSLRTKVADLTQVQTECARLYAVLQASMENVLQNHGSLPLNLNGHGERRHIIRSLRGTRTAQPGPAAASNGTCYGASVPSATWTGASLNARPKSGSLNRFKHSPSRQPENSFAYCTSSTYPIQLRSPEEEFVGWVKHRWAY